MASLALNYCPGNQALHQASAAGIIRIGECRAFFAKTGKASPLVLTSERWREPKVCLPKNMKLKIN